MQATSKDLRFHTKEILDAAIRGEEVIITFRGKPCAKIIPSSEPDGDSKKMNSVACGKIERIWTMLKVTFVIFEKGDHFDCRYGYIDLVFKRISTGN